MKTLLITISLLFFAHSAHANEEKVGDRNPNSSNLLRAYLNLAEALAAERANNRVCDTEAYQSTILTALNSARYLEGFSASMVAGSVKAQLEGNIFLKEILGEVDLWSDSVSEFKKAIGNSIFHGPAMGAFGSTETLKFGANQTVVLEKDRFDEDYSNRLPPEIFTGTWDVRISKNKKSPYSANMVRVAITFPKFKGGKKKTLVYRFSRIQLYNGATWVLHTSPKDVNGADIDYSKVKFYNEIVDECDA